MSDQNSTISALEEQISLLQNALKREQNAKRKLEAKLEVKLQTQFDENKEFLQAYENATSRQIQLQFLSSLTSDIFSITNLDKMLARFLANIAKFLEPCHAYILSKDKEVLTLSHLNLTDEVFQEIKQSLPLIDLYNQLESLSLSDLWQRVDTSNFQLLTLLHEGKKQDTTLIYPLALTRNKFRYLILNIDHFCYSQDFKQTLNTASKQFSIAIQRLITEVELTYNYKKLKSTLQQLTSTQHQLVHSEKMASLGQLSAGIAHEINNPLGYITSNFEVLKEYCDLFEQTFSTLEHDKSLPNSRQLTFAREDISELIASCIKGVGRISEIVGSLKTFSRKDQGKFELINLNLIIEDSLKIVWNQLKYDHQVEKQLIKDLPLVSACEGQLQQVFINLFINATQAMEQRGKLTVTTLANDKHVEVIISDTGCGMKQETIDKLFEPFYTTKQGKGGTGLGLSVSYAIMERHQAQISVKSELGVGSTFQLIFPLPLIS